MGFFTDVPEALNMVNEAALRVASYHFSAVDLDAAVAPDQVDDQHMVAYLAFYPALRKVLARQPWRSIARVTTLDFEISNLLGYAYAYSLPADWIRPVGFWDGFHLIEPEDGLYSRWAVWGNVLYTGFPITAASYVYIPVFNGYNAADWTAFLQQMPPMLRECMVLQIAYDICYTIKRDLNRKKDLYTELEIALTMAHEQDAASRQCRISPPGNMVRVRFS